MKKEIEVFWHMCTQRELADLLTKLEVALVPTGSTEIHGPHLAVGNDILTCTKVAEEIARKMYPKAIVVNAL